MLIRGPVFLATNPLETVELVTRPRLLLRVSYITMRFRLIDAVSVPIHDPKLFVPRTTRLNVVRVVIVKHLLALRGVTCVHMLRSNARVAPALLNAELLGTIMLLAIVSTPRRNSGLTVTMLLIVMLHR